MTRKTDHNLENRNKVRALRRARRYIRANEGSLARLLNTYQRIGKLDPSRLVWAEQ